MSEPYLAVPGPEPDSNWDPKPARCPECGTIIDAHPAMRKDAHWEGWCPKHGNVPAVYRNSISDSEMADEKEMP